MLKAEIGETAATATEKVQDSQRERYHDIEPLANPGPPIGSRNAAKDKIKGNNVTFNSTERGNHADYLMARLKRDAPAIADAYERGEFPSVRQAAIAAGIVRVPTRLELAKQTFLRLSDGDRDSFDRWREELRAEKP